jgi:hypothetical protein
MCKLLKLCIASLKVLYHLVLGIFPYYFDIILDYILCIDYGIKSKWFHFALTLTFILFPVSIQIFLIFSNLPRPIKKIKVFRTFFRTLLHIELGVM